MSACNTLDHLNRRTLLTLAGASGLAWLTPIANLLAQEQEQAARGAPAKSIIMLWMAGAPSQCDTFDPHPGTKIGGDVKGLKTAIAGCQIASGFEQMAEELANCTLVRNVTSKEGDHERGTYTVKTGNRPDPTTTHPAIGSILCHELPTDAVRIPRHVSIFPGAWPARGGYLGDKYDAFQMFDPKFPLPDVTPSVLPPRFEERLKDLEIVERDFARGRLPKLDERKTLHRSTIAQAKDVMTNEQRHAFDVSRATEAERQAFGDTPFGRGCLAAARLIETGVRCVEVTLDGWDTHADNHTGQSLRVGIVDPAFAALLRYLRERKDAGGRSLFESTIVVWGGEFGRTPQINGISGRDHWPHGFNVVLAGGGMRRGYVHGATDPEGGRVEFDKGTPIENLHATLLAALKIDQGHTYVTPTGRPIRYSDGKVVKELLAS